jgi:hypothetical protein
MVDQQNVFDFLRFRARQRELRRISRDPIYRKTLALSKCMSGLFLGFDVGAYSRCYLVRRCGNTLPQAFGW